MRASAPWGVLVVLAAPAPTWALGLGDIELHSALNQPFRAEIGLTGTPEELQSLRVGVADRATFERSGLERPLFMSDFNFRVAQNAAGRNVITVTSQQSVAEPFVTMIIEATSSSGVLQREYTVFLDPPVLLSRQQAAPPVAPPQTRAPAPQTSAAPIARQPATPAPAPAPTPRATTPAPQGTGREGTHGPVQRSETLWAIAERYQPAGVTMNQMMVAIYDANREAFGGNINVLRAGTILRIPGRDDAVARSAADANAEVQRQNQAWRQGVPAPTSTNDRLVLVPPSTDDVAPSTGSGRTTAPANGAQVAALRDEVDSLRAELEESRRLLDVRNRELSDLQRQLSDEAQPAPTEAAVVDNTNTSPGVDLDDQQVFADAGEAPAAEAPAAETPAPAVAPPATQTRAVTPRAPRAPTLMERVTGMLSSWMALVVAGVGAILFVGLWFMRRRREHDVEDVTGQWDALEAGMDRAQATRAREPRMSVPSSRAAADRSSVEDALADNPFMVEERASSSSTTLPIDDAEEIAAGHYARAGEAHIDDTMSTSAVLNLDEADPVAEADFHMAYGLYDQAAELLGKELKQHPNRRDLQLKLLEVFFVWGNKDEFLDAAQHLRDQMGAKIDSDWDKVLIMGKQICPDAALFAEAAAGGGAVDVALGTGDTGSIDFSFEETADGDESDLLDIGDATSLGIDDEIDLDLTGNRPSPGLEATSTLNIGADTAAGLEAALFDSDEADEDAETLAVGRIDPESLIETQETPALRGGVDDIFGDVTIESPTVEQMGAEQPTVESPGLDTGATMLQQTAILGHGDDDDEELIGTAEMPGLTSSSTGAELTAELELNDLGLDVSGIDDAFGLDDIASELDSESGDTREQPVLEADAELLSATGITQVLREETGSSALGANDQTQLQSGGTMLGTAERKARVEAETQLMASSEDDFDLDLDDLSAALSDADTIEQPQEIDFGLSSTKSTPIDLDVGETFLGDDDPTGTEDMRGMDPQTLTEVGTKLDLARAYIDMGDPEGARSILEEVLAEGDGAQRDEAQNLIDAIGA